MNDLSDKFLDYMNGGLAAEEEQKLFTTMAYDNELRDEFRSFVAIDKTLKSTSGSFVPSVGATNAVYSSLGLKFPNELAASEVLTKIPFYQSKFFTGAMTGLTFALVPFVAYLLFFMPKSGDVDLNINMAELSNKAEIPVIESVEDMNVHPVTESKPEIRYVYIDRIVKDGSNEDMVIANPVVQEENDMKSISPITFSDTKLIPGQKINFDRHAPDFELSNMPVETYLQQTFNLLDGNSGFGIEVRGSTNWNIPTETLYPKKISEFVNSGIALQYELTDWLIVGADVRQETFFVKYNGEDQYGQRFKYEQHPNLTSYGFNLRFMPIEIYKFDPYFNFNFGINNYGEVLRGAFGTEYSLYSDIAFIFELEYSYLFFNHKNTLFDTRKIGVNYGVKYKY